MRTRDKSEKARGTLTAEQQNGIGRSGMDSLELIGAQLCPGDPSEREIKVVAAPVVQKTFINPADC